MSDAAGSFPSLRDRIGIDRPLVVAHRGDWRDAPENSRAAIVAAGAFDMVEIDVRLSADGVPFVMHDDTLERTAGHPARVKELTADELSGIRLLGSDETVPSLAEALAVADPALYFDIDVKDAGELDDVAAFLAARGETDRVMVKQDVDDAESLDALKALEARHGVPVTAKARLARDADLQVIDALSRAGVMAAEVGFSRIDLVAEACAAGVPISVYTLDEIAGDGFSDAAGRRDPAAIWGHLAAIGVRLLMTDAPEIVKAHLDGRQS